MLTAGLLLAVLGALVSSAAGQVSLCDIGSYAMLLCHSDAPTHHRYADTYVLL